MATRLLFALLSCLLILPAWAAPLDGRIGSPSLDHDWRSLSTAQGERI